MGKLVKVPDCLTTSSKTGIANDGIANPIYLGVSRIRDRALSRGRKEKRKKAEEKGVNRVLITGQNESLGSYG